MKLSNKCKTSLYHGVWEDGRCCLTNILSCERLCGTWDQQAPLVLIGSRPPRKNDTTICFVLLLSVTYSSFRQLSQWHPGSLQIGNWNSLTSNITLFIHGWWYILVGVNSGDKILFPVCETDKVYINMHGTYVHILEGGSINHRKRRQII